MTESIKKINICGLLFDNVDMDQAINILQQKIKSYKGKRTSLLCAANQDIINQINKFRKFTLKEINDNSVLIIPDGYSIVYASKFLKIPLKERVTGPDLMEKFIKISAQKGYKNFFLGGEKGVAEKMADNFLNKYHGLEVSGIYSPPFGEFSKQENEKIINMVNNSKSDILWVSFGCPKQEKWIIDNIDNLNVPISAGVGAAFNFHSGIIKRAPKILQKLRLEWFYRFLQEPSRLWKRYFMGGLYFLITIIKQKYKKDN